MVQCSTYRCMTMFTLFRTVKLITLVDVSFRYPTAFWIDSKQWSQGLLLPSLMAKTPLYLKLRFIIVHYYTIII